MIQFNLLPDVKLEYVRVQRAKQTVITAAIIAASSAFLIFLLMFVAVNLVQKKSISDLNGDIKKYSKQLQGTADLEKILTIQSQLSVLPTLHQDKVAASRTFTFIQQLTPANVSLADVTVDYSAKTFSITGQAATLDQVNTFVDTLKFTKYSNDKVEKQPAFSQVAMSQYSRSQTGTTYTITLNYDEAVFDNTSDVRLIVPTRVTTGSVVEQPTNIFQKLTTPTTTKTNPGTN